MDKKDVKQVARDVRAAWDNGVERALTDMARDEETIEQLLNEVTGMRVESGLRGGGLWGTSEKNTCTCGFSCVYC